jgi:hypothetical protein
VNKLPETLSLVPRISSDLSVERSLAKDSRVGGGEDRGDGPETGLPPPAPPEPYYCPAFNLALERDLRLLHDPQTPLPPEVLLKHFENKKV